MYWVLEAFICYRAYVKVIWLVKCILETWELETRSWLNRISVNLMYIGPCIIVIREEKETNLMSQFITFYFTSMLNMFRTLIQPSPGACDFSIVSPHWLCVLDSMCVGVAVWLGWGGICVAGWSTNCDIKLVSYSSRMSVGRGWVVNWLLFSTSSCLSLLLQYHFTTKGRQLMWSWQCRLLQQVS